MQQDKNQPAQRVVPDNGLQLRAAVLKYLSYWKWFLVSIVFFVFLGFDGAFLRQQRIESGPGI